MNQKRSEQGGIKGTLVKMALTAVIAVAVVQTFDTEKPAPVKEPFSMRTCLETIPEDVEGLKILEGTRTRGNLIADMVPFVCNGELIFKRLQEQGEPIHPGELTFKTEVEYNGEVLSLAITESSIDSHKFHQQMKRLILESDFSMWNREKSATVFTYKARFGDR